MVTSIDRYEKYRCTQHQSTFRSEGRDSNTIVGFNSPITIMDRVSGQKINKAKADLNYTTDKQT